MNVFFFLLVCLFFEGFVYSCVDNALYGVRLRRKESIKLVSQRKCCIVAVVPLQERLCAVYAARCQPASCHKPKRIAIATNTKKKLIRRLCSKSENIFEVQIVRRRSMVLRRFSRRGEIASQELQELFCVILEAVQDRVGTSIECISCLRDHHEITIESWAGVCVRRADREVL